MAAGELLKPGDDKTWEELRALEKELIANELPTEPDVFSSEIGRRMVHLWREEAPQHPSSTEYNMMPDVSADQ